MTTVFIIWWFFIIVALMVTVVDVMLLTRVIQTARRINNQGKRALQAARGIAASTGAIQNCEATANAAVQILSAAGPVVKTGEAIAQKLT